MKNPVFRWLALRVVFLLLKFLRLLEILTLKKNIPGVVGASIILIFSCLIIFNKDSVSRIALELYSAQTLVIEQDSEVPVRYPIKAFDIPLPDTTVYSALVMEKNVNKELYQYNSEEIIPPASTTKLMTALVALDLYDFEDVLRVPRECTLVEGSKTGFPEGISVSVDNLLNALLIESSADAACTLASSRVSYWEFLNRMNTKAKDFGMKKTSFSNPIGLDADGNQVHYSTARDLYRLAFIATSKPEIKDIVKKRYYYVSSVDGTFTKYITNTNKLLGEIPHTTGVKTGTTAAAGEVLIYEYENEGKDIVIVVMGSSNRFYDTRALLSWTLRSYDWGF